MKTYCFLEFQNKAGEVKRFFVDAEGVEEINDS